MKPDERVSEIELNDLIESYGFIKRPENTVMKVLAALLELKQRREAENRESDPALDPCNQPENIR